MKEASWKNVKCISGAETVFALSELANSFGGENCDIGDAAERGKEEDRWLPGKERQTDKTVCTCSQVSRVHFIPSLKPTDRRREREALEGHLTLAEEEGTFTQHSCSNRLGIVN